MKTFTARLLANRRVVLGPLEPAAIATGKSSEFLLKSLVLLLPIALAAVQNAPVNTKTTVRIYLTIQHDEISLVFC